MSDLRNFLTKRRKEIAETLGPLLDQRALIDLKIHRLQRELSDLDEAAKAVGLRENPPTGDLVAESRSRPEITIKEAVLEILKDHPNGLIALDILAKINERFKLGISRTSLSPQLSRLKHDGKIANFRDVWRPIAQKKQGPAR